MAEGKKKWPFHLQTLFCHLDNAVLLDLLRAHKSVLRRAYWAGISLLFHRRPNCICRIGLERDACLPLHPLISHLKLLELKRALRTLRHRCINSTLNHKMNHMVHTVQLQTS